MQLRSFLFSSCGGNFRKTYWANCVGRIGFYNFDSNRIQNQKLEHVIGVDKQTLWHLMAKRIYATFLRITFD
jgi:hypothetical protein